MKIGINRSKAGFTVIEVSIVIVVIAILAAVFIPSFSGVGDQADLSADQTNLTNMNAALDSAETLKKKCENITAVHELLNRGGYSRSGFIPNTASYCYVWDETHNRIFMVDIASDNVVYPEDYTSIANTGAWYVLDTSERYPCPPAFAREKFVTAVSYYSGTLDNADPYAGTQAGQQYALLVAKISCSIRGIDKSAVCYAIYDSNYSRLITDVNAAFRLKKTVYTGTIPLGGGGETQSATACRIIEIADAEGNIVDFFNGHINNVGGAVQTYFFADGRLGGDMNSAVYNDTHEIIFDENVFIFPMLSDFTDSGTAPTEELIELDA